MNQYDTISSSTLESRVIDWLRFPMAALVVLIHTGSQGVFSSYPIYSSLCIFFPKWICQLAVPLFFLVSGYLFFFGLERWGKDMFFSKLKRRIKSLLIPYILWNIIAIILLYFYSTFKMWLRGDPPIGFLDQILKWKGIRVFWDCDHGMPLDYPLWYIRDLILLAIASPLILVFIRKTKWIGIAILSFFYLVFINIHFLVGLLFYSIGCCLRVSKKSILEISRTLRWPSLIFSCSLLLAIVLFFQKQPQLTDHLIRAFMLSGVFSLFYLVSLLFDKHIINNTPLLTRYSFFIFASHGILILNEFAHYIVLHTLPVSGETYYCIDLFLRPLIAIAICIGLYYTMSNFAPRTLGVLTGGRIRPITASS